MRATHRCVVTMIVALIAMSAAAQDRGGQRGGAPAGPAMTMTIAAFPDGTDVPVKFSQAAPGAAPGEGTSPAITWANAPATGPRHDYMFELYALDTKIDVQPAADAFETRANVMKAIHGHILAKAVYGGLFKRPQ